VQDVAAALGIPCHQPRAALTPTHEQGWAREESSLFTLPSANPSVAMHASTEAQRAEWELFLEARARWIHDRAARSPELSVEAVKKLWNGSEERRRWPLTMKASGRYLVLQRERERERERGRGGGRGRKRQRLRQTETESPLADEGSGLALCPVLVLLLAFPLRIPHRLLPHYHINP